ncbi:hypothetical protein ACOME3_005697 [Neoechinorhynchus agilis]
MPPGDSNNRRLIVQDDTDHEENERFLLYRVQRDHGYLRSIDELTSYYTHTDSFVCTLTLKRHLPIVLHKEEKEERKSCEVYQGTRVLAEENDRYLNFS